MRALLALLCLFLALPASADRTLLEWRFDRPDALRDWRPNGEIREISVTGGALQFRCEGSDPILDYARPFAVEASPWQAIEVRMKADRPGMVEIFWSGTTEGPDGGLSQDKVARISALGDAQWHTYRVLPFWQKERRIVRLRFDPYDGARFALASLRVVEAERGSQPMPNGARVRRVGALTRLTCERPGGFALLPVPPADAAKQTVVSLRAATRTARRIALVYASTESYGQHELGVTLVPDGTMRRYNLEMLSAPGWTGRIVAVGIRPGQRAGESVDLAEIRVAARALGPPELRPIWFGIEEALPRAGLPVTVSARATNAGGETARAVRAALSLPAGARVLSAPPADGAGLRFAQDGVWKWRVVFGKPGAVRLGLRLSAANAAAVSSAAAERVTARVAVAARGAMPPPQPVGGKVDVGVYYFPGWRTAANWAPIMRFPERRPVLGWYREGEPSIADWHVKWALEHGITFLAYDWYWSQGARSLEHALHDGLFRSRYGNLLKFCLLWANHNAPNTSSYDDLQAATRYWLDNYFRRSNYYTIDGKPVVIIFTPHRFRADMGSDEVRRAFDAMKEACRGAGLPGLYLIACVGGDTAEAHAAAREGYDAITAYNWPGLGVPGDSRWAPFDTLPEAYRRQWQALADASPLPMMLPVSGGWDSRPWHGEAALVRYGRNPASFRRHLAQAREFIERHPGKTLPVALIEAWNEFGEGSYIEPQKEFGFGYLDAIREVFTSAPPHHDDVTPADVGIAPPQVEMASLTQAAWSFGRGLQGWGAMMGTTDPHLAGGALTLRTTSADPALTSPPLQVPADAHRVLLVRMRLRAVSGEAFTDVGQLFWATPSAPISEAASVRFSVRGDGQWHDYRVALSANPRWRGIISGLRFDPCNRNRVEIDIARIELK
ncbi:MAG: glycoside hydrolase family 99-like domain-containing protein [Chthonomonadales bacterium]|nr:glycoside hydrolase family 99-like domain-containing protein [Chthonomonadales bacterium]